MANDGCRRRRFLYRAGVVATAGALAGCAGGNGSSDSGGDSTPAGTGGATGGEATATPATETDAPATEMGTTTEAATTTGTGPTGATTTGMDSSLVTEPAPPAVDRFLEPANFYDGDMVVGVSLVGVGGSGEQIGFDPAAIEVATGTTVTWEWISGAERHSVTSTDTENERVSFNSGPRVGTGTTFQYTFERPGIYRYICGVHRAEGARGVVIVAPGNDVGGTGSG